MHYGRLAAVRGFATYLRGVDPTVEIPSVELLRNGPPRRRPFLYSDEEILALIDAAATFRTAHRAATYRTLIGLLASTGIRVGEAIGLDRGDFDPSLGVIVVRGKLEKIRELPLSPSTTAALRRIWRAATGRRRRRGSGRCSCPWPARVWRSTVWSRRSSCYVIALASRPRREPTDGARAAAHVRDPHDARRLPRRR